MATPRKKTRMYEPWGYREENEYVSNASRIFSDLDEFFTGARYSKKDNKIHFYNKEGEEKTESAIDVSEFKTAGVIKDAYYDSETQEIVIEFTNGDEVRISVKDLIDINEFGDGLQVNDGIVSIKLAEGDNTDKYISLDENGLSAHLIDEVIDALTERISENAQAIADERERAIEAEQALAAILSGSTEALEDLIEKLGYKDNDTLITTNPHEVAFGEYNISNTDENPSGQTIFSIGNGTSDENRSNALEIRKDGDVYLLVEGEMMNINELLGQIAHEVYD